MWKWLSSLTRGKWARAFLVVILFAALLPQTRRVDVVSGLEPFPHPARWVPLGDVDGDGDVDLDDARLVARYVAGGKVEPLPYPGNADATQDGIITIDDALAIAQWVMGRSRVVTAAPEYGIPGVTYVGSLIRIEVCEHFFPLHVTGGTVRIKALSTGYDSGDRKLVFEHSGRALYYHWDTSGLLPASDYEVYVTLTESEVLRNQASTNDASQPKVTLALNARPFEMPQLAQTQDAYAPAPGIPLEFRRAYPQDSTHILYVGPLGSGWIHNYDIHLEEFTDGRVAFVGSSGFNRWFQSNADGTYTASPGDHGVLTRDPDGTYQLKEKDGFIYRFRYDLRLDYLLDTNGNRVSATYDRSNHLIEIHHSYGESFFLEYNDAGRIIRLTDPVGRVTTYEYDPMNLMLTKVTDPAGNVTEYAYSVGQSDVLNHRLLSIVFPDGTRTQYEYDSQARLIRQTGAWGANPVSWSYDEDGTTHITDAISSTITIQVNDRGQPVTITDPDGGQTQMQYDTSADLTAITDPLAHLTQMGYDQFGNVVTVTNPLSETVQYGYDLRFSKPSSVTNPLGYTTLFEYGTFGSLRTTTYPDTSQVTFTYDTAGNLATFTDSLGHTTSYSYNRQGLMTSLENAHGDATQFAYDAAGNLEQVTDASGHDITYARDLLGRVTRITYPDGSHEDYEYDAMGKVTAFTNRRGERTAYSYDLTGRLEWKEHPSGKKTHFQYDDRGGISRIEVESGETTALDTYYEHDLSRRLTLVEVPGKVTPESYDVSYAYDAAGNRRYMSYPDGYGLNYAYDAANRLIRIADAGDHTIVAYQYDTAGRRTQRTLGNGTYTTYEYDVLDRLTRLVNYAPEGTVQSQFEYTYDAAGMRTSMTTLEGTYTYTYDDIHQLTSVVYPDGRTVEYAFDAVGNRTTVTDTGVVTGYVTNVLDQYTQVGTDTFSYDTTGNLMTRTLGSDVIIYGWDEDDRLVSVDRAGVHIEYRYDYIGRLVAKIVGDQETRYVWDGLDLMAEMDSAGNVVKRYVYGSNIDEVIVVTADGTTSWGQQDGLGSIVGTTSETGAVIATSSYDVYGSVRRGSAGPLPQRFAGMWWDDDAGLYYVRARWYDPTMGRFISVDPIAGVSTAISWIQTNNLRAELQYGSVIDSSSALRYYAMDTVIHTAGGLHAYSYATNSPVVFVDQIGLWEVQISIPTPWLVGPTISFGYNTTTGQSSFGISVGVGVGVAVIPSSQPARGWSGSGFMTAVRGAWFSETPQSWSGGWLNAWGIGGGFGFGWNWTWGGGGVCPTFIQLPSDVQVVTSSTTHLDVSQEPLAGEITVPIEGALLRADVPIFGVAGGTDFAAYRVEYGEGSNPTAWHLIASSTVPQPTTDVGPAEMQFMQGDVDIRGNLATWNTGLKNWVHLPWHLPEDLTDLNGIYTLRLVVTGKDGQAVEDRMTVEVGRAIAQALPGVALSPDQRIVMRFPEQSLTHPFRVYTILPLSDVGEETPPAPEGGQWIGPVYRIREPGDHFVKDVILEFGASAEELVGHDAGQVGITRYDVESQKWFWLPTGYSLAGDTTTFSTPLGELPKSEAIYALVLDAANVERSQPQAEETSVLDPLMPVDAGVLIHDTFEQDVGYWKPRDRLVGAGVARDNEATNNGSYALKMTNELYGGNFSVTVLDRPFDVREYPLMSFDYRIPQGVKTDFYLRVNGRWYNLGFTDDPTDFHNSDVNIGNLGQIEGVTADDQWHSVSVNLYQLLRQKTHYTQVEAIMMADWDVGGYMKLDFGQNARGATYYVDNFTIAAAPAAETSDVLLVDTFDPSEATNLVGGPSGTFSNPGTEYCQAAIVDDALVQTIETAGEDWNHVLQLTFDTSHEDAFCGYWTALMAANVEGMDDLSLRLRAEDVPSLLVGLRHAGTGIEASVPIQPYLTIPDQNGWRTVTVPLFTFLERGLPDLSVMDTFFVTFDNRISSGQGSLVLDDLQFRRAPASTGGNPDWGLADYNFMLGSESWTIEHGAAAISAGYHEDTTSAQADSVDAVRISYGGTIGLDYGGREFSYAIWEADLLGIDARGFQSLILRIRGEKGDERPNIYLDDGTTRRPARAKEFPALTTSWQEIYLPLEDFASQGVDLSHLEALQIVFEWEEMSGTIYIAGIRFGGAAP